jgi:alkylation response protein AidB-like acyl-CoA dehydrogenase
LLGAKLPDDGAAAIFNGNGWPIAAGLIFPFGDARSVPEGGYRLTGRWRFGSGIQQASWVASGCRILDGDTPRTTPGGSPFGFVAVLPKSHVTVHDTWHTAGLRGTGSCDYTIEDQPVPESFTFATMISSGYRGGAWWRILAPAQATPGHSGFALGIARRCLDEVKAIGDRRRYASPSKQAERESVQMELGRRIAEYEAVRLFVLDELAATLDRAERGEPLTRGPASAYATEMAVRCAEFAYRVTGGDAVFESSPVQRYLRDVFAAQQHFAASDSAFTFYGKQALDAAAAEQAADASSAG